MLARRRALGQRRIVVSTAFAIRRDADRARIAVQGNIVRRKRTRPPCARFTARAWRALDAGT